MKRTKEEAKETKLKLQKTALALFIEQGYDNTTLNRIAVKAGVTKGAIYWHFKDKAAILDDIIEYYDRSAELLLPQILNLRESPLTKIKILVYGNVPEFSNKTKIRNFYRLRMEIANHYKKRGGQPYAFTFLEEVAKLFNEAKRLGEVKDNVDQNTASLTMSVMISGTYFKYGMDEAFFDHVESHTSIMDSYFDLVSTEKGKQNTRDFREITEKKVPQLYNNLKKNETQN